MSMSANSIAGTPSASALVVDAVAAREGVDPLELEVPLYSAIDADSLDRVMDTDAPVEVTFAYYGYEVTVAADGSVTLTETA